jgi:hypothetical protein
VILVRNLLEFLRRPTYKLDKLVAEYHSVPDAANHEVNDGGYYHGRVIYFHGVFSFWGLRFEDHSLSVNQLNNFKELLASRELRNQDGGVRAHSSPSRMEVNAVPSVEIM